jgi:hypothetical protein
MGPRRVVLDDDGSVPPPPVRLTDNAQTWLPFTDLVFVDPPGTGYSRLLEEYSTGEKGAKEGPDGKTPAWGIEEDAELLGAFIRRYLTQAAVGFPRLLRRRELRRLPHGPAGRAAVREGRHCPERYRTMYRAGGTRKAQYVVVLIVTATQIAREPQNPRIHASPRR